MLNKRCGTLSEAFEKHKFDFETFKHNLLTSNHLNTFF